MGIKNIYCHGYLTTDKDSKEDGVHLLRSGRFHLWLYPQNPDKNDETPEPYWWFPWRKYRGKSASELSIEWRVPFPSKLGWSIRVGGYGSEEDVSVALYGGWFAVWTSLQNVLPRRWLERSSKKGSSTYHDDDRSIELFFWDGSFRWSLWSRTNEWSASDPQWMQGYYNPVDTICGKFSRSATTLDTTYAEVALPEGNYPIKITWEKVTIGRERFPFSLLAKTRYDADVECLEKGIPIPGKGENSWDMGEDALFATGVSDVREGNIAKVVSSIAEHVLRIRERRESIDWRPSIKHVR